MRCGICCGDNGTSGIFENGQKTFEVADLLLPWKDSGHFNCVWKRNLWPTCGCYIDGCQFFVWRNLVYFPSSVDQFLSQWDIHTSLFLTFKYCTGLWTAIAQVTSIRGTCADTTPNWQRQSPKKRSFTSQRKTVGLLPDVRWSPLPVTSAGTGNWLQYLLVRHFIAWGSGPPPPTNTQ